MSEAQYVLLNKLNQSELCYTSIIYVHYIGTKLILTHLQITTDILIFNYLQS